MTKGPTMRRATMLTACIAVSALLSGCGGDDLPTKAEFVEKMGKETKAEFTKALDSAGVDPAQADQLFSDMVGCVYDKMAENEDELRAISDSSNSAEFNKVMAGKAAPCLTDFQKAVTDAMSSKVGG